MSIEKISDVIEKGFSELKAANAASFDKMNTAFIESNNKLLDYLETFVNKTDRILAYSDSQRAKNDSEILAHLEESVDILKKELELSEQAAESIVSLTKNSQNAILKIVPDINIKGIDSKSIEQLMKNYTEINDMQKTIMEYLEKEQKPEGGSN